MEPKVIEVFERTEPPRWCQSCSNRHQGDACKDMRLYLNDEKGAMTWYRRGAVHLLFQSHVLVLETTSYMKAFTLFYKNL